MPDGLNTYAIGWERGGTALWIADATSIRRVNFAEQKAVKEDRWSRADVDKIEGFPKPVRDALEKQLPAAATPANLPRDKDAQALLKGMQFRKLADGTYPADALQSLKYAIEYQLKNKPDWPHAAAAQEWLGRIANAKGWMEADLCALLDEAASWPPVVSVSISLEEFAAMEVVQPGKPATKEQLAKLAWGKPAENGLRAACYFEPMKDEYPDGQLLNRMIVFHNSCDKPVQISTELWRQED